MSFIFINYKQCEQAIQRFRLITITKYLLYILKLLVFWASVNSNERKLTIVLRDELWYLKILKLGFSIFYWLLTVALIKKTIVKSRETRLHSKLSMYYTESNVLSSSHFLNWLLAKGVLPDFELEYMY